MRINCALSRASVKKTRKRKLAKYQKLLQPQRKQDCGVFFKRLKVSCWEYAEHVLDWEITRIFTFDLFYRHAISPRIILCKAIKEPCSTYNFDFLILSYQPGKKTVVMLLREIISFLRELV